MKICNNGVIFSWGHNITRSISLAATLELTDVHIQPHFSGSKLKIVNYAIASVKMLFNLFTKKPDLVIVTLPPMFLLYVVFFYKLITFNKCLIVADLHNGVLRREWRHWPFLSYFLGKCHVVLSHNNQVKKSIDGHFSINSQVLTDPLKNYSFNENVSRFILDDKINVLVPLSYAEDEPVAQIVKSALSLSGNFNFIFTGNFKKYFKESIDELPITFTGFINYEDYETVLGLCDIVLCLTLNDDIQMCAVIESISAEKPFICANNSVNNELFKDYYFAVTKCVHEDISQTLVEFKTSGKGKKDTSSLKTKYDLYWANIASAIFNNHNSSVL
jgi:glycosyltransferase involved in cell wall biosynthesis